MRLERVTFSYGDGKDMAPAALRDVSLEIRAGEIIALIGQNGSGKTTLAKHMNGLLKADSGRVFVGGLDTRDEQVGNLARHVGYVFQNPDHALFLPTVREEIAYGPRRLGIPEQEIAAKVDETLQRFRLEDYADHHPAALGRGLRRLTVLAAIYAMDPSVFVLDEPTGGLDARLEAQLVDIIASLAQEGHAVVLITHEMDLAARVAHRVALLSRGQLLADGDPAKVFADAELLEEAGIQPPIIARLAQRLSRFGFPAGITTVDEFITTYQRLLNQVEAER